MRVIRRILLSAALIFLTTAGCAIRRVSVNPPVLTFQSEQYMVIETPPGTFTAIVRSKAVISEIQKRLGCDKEHVCAGQRYGEIWIIEELK